MKKFIIVVSLGILLATAVWYIYYGLGVYIPVSSDEPVRTFMKTDSDTVYMDRCGKYEPFEIRGVDLGAGMPGEWATDFAIDKETYLRWFGMIQDLGANTIRIYTIHD